MIAREGVRWALRALAGLVANLVLLTVWVDIVGVPAELAIIPNWVILSTTMYVVTDQWVFSKVASAGSPVGHIKRFVGSESIMLSSKLGNYVIYVLLLRVIDYRLAWVVGAGVMFLASFGLNRWWWRYSSGST